MTSKTKTSRETILDYKLQERIGAGGFGEVWSAIAPGGLLKAVKIVYGFHDENRAQAELKALDRVKQLRHPFLLSLERIEIFEGQLVVVTELADNSLADVFNEHAHKGSPGIPREDLLKYMRSVADALDYMSDEHNLQHLDVKPENLLMVSGHVKVADFGLIKDLDNASQSLMSGMTPAYAAPELFDGRPGTKSDQYSLAIVYQEMLTGARPFPGNTPAQLAAQHMHGKPNLRPLPKGDQAVIAKALSKDPDVRFKSCREMIEELANKKRSVKKAIRRTPTTRVGSETDSKPMDANDSSVYRDVTAVISKMGLPFHAAELQSLDPPDCDETTASMRPTLVITVGATANHIAQKIKARIVNRHGTPENVPSFRILSVDTDRNALGDCRTGSGSAGLVSDEIIETPLRRPEDYRDRSTSHLAWLSRRWIYNVPRSLQTEGLRPLGRLALADHFDNVCDRIQSALLEIVAEENLARSADTLELDPGELKPRVYVITSISGGVGSGMVLDLAYTIKLLMHENGLSSGTVVGLLLHSTYQRTRDAGLSAANAFACLTEMRHYVENGFPGDSSIGLPEFGDEPPFDFTYFNDLGNDLKNSEFEQKLDRIAEYVYLSTTSKCSVFFDQCRTLETEIEHLSLRTFGICSTGPNNLAMSEIAVDRVGRGLVRRWIGGDPSSEFDPSLLVASQLEQHELDHERVLSKINDLTQEVLDGKFDAMMGGAKDIAKGSSKDRMQTLSAYLDGLFGCPPARRDSGHVDPEICHEMEELVTGAGRNIGEQMAAVALDMVRGDDLLLYKSRRTTEALFDKLSELRDQMEQAYAHCEADTRTRLQNLKYASEEKRSKRDDESRFEMAFDFYCLKRLQEFVLRYAKAYYRGIANSLESAREMVVRIQSQLESVAHHFDFADHIPSAENVDEFSMDRLLSDSVEQAIESHITKTELQVYESLIKDGGGYLAVLNEPTMVQHRLPLQIRVAAQRVLADAYKKVSLERVIAQNNIGPEQLVKWLGERIREARPLVDDCGGASRLLIGLPALSEDSIVPEMIEKHFHARGCSINGTQGNFVICFEGENIALANVAFRLLEARPDAIELVKRIHTRKDIDWLTLDDLL